MRLKRSISAMVTALGLVVLTAATASAQSPTLNVTANGTVVTIQWTDLSHLGAQAYNIEVGTTPGGKELGFVNLPASLTRVVVNAPPGTYYLRVRGFAGNIVGPFSNEVGISVGAAPVPCGPMTAPTVAAAGSGYLSVKVDWTPVAGATSYVVEYSRVNGITELAEAAPPGVASVTKYAGFTGNFFARVVARNACGEVVASPYVPFTIVNSPGSGPRTPDPAPGQIIQRSTLGYLRSVVEEVAAQHRGDLLNSCATHTFMYRVVQRLRTIDSRWGLNYKRGHTGDLSHDIVAYNQTNRPDAGESMIYLYDIIAGHCGSSPGPNWQDVTDPTWAGRGSSACGTEWCAQWTLEPYLRAGFPPDQRP